MRHLRNTLLILFLAGRLLAQTNSLPRSTPEAEGVSSEAIIDFLDAAAKTSHEFHSVMILRHGKVVAEGWWNPYAPDLKHTLYSVSKSFTATAVGLAVADGKLSLDDKVISFFTEESPAQISPYLAELKVRHLLTMSVGQKTDPTGDVGRKKDWVKAFLATPIIYEPGTKFLYNSAATYTLSAIVQKVTGHKIVDYLKARLFDPLAISGMDWEVDPNGVNTGGWGLRLKTEDLAKFGQLFLQNGKWNGNQILPAAWVADASSMKIMQDPNARQSKKDSSDWLQGYCFQMWRSRHHSYRADGAFGQFILVLPDQDAVIAITAETANMQDEINLVWDHLLSAFHEKKLPANGTASKELKRRLAALSLPLPGKIANSKNEAAISEKTYTSVSPDRRLKSYGLDFKNGICTLKLNTDSAEYQYQFGAGRWIKGTTTKFGPYLVARAQSNRVGLPSFITEGSYGWVDEKTVDLTLRYIESPHTETIRCTIDSPYVSLDFINSFSKSTSGSFKGLQLTTRPNAPRLIVRGDDMGFSHAADVALIKSYKHGIETSIEVIAPSPWFPETARLLQETKGVDVGLHFAITSEWDNVKWKPLTDVPSLQSPDGYFYPMLQPNKNYPKMSVSENGWKIEDVEKELRAQIHLALKYIPRISHISGHMGSSTFSPEVKAMVAKVAKEFNIPDPDTKATVITYVGFDSANKTTNERIEGFITMLNKLEDGKTYLFVEHPGLDNEELRAIYHIGYEDVAKGRQDVTTIFTSQKVKEAVLKKGIALVSYKDVLSGH